MYDLKLYRFTKHQATGCLINWKWDWEMLTGTNQFWPMKTP